MNASVEPQHTDISCPRCGYDLHGPVASWGEWCPLEGACPECGLPFAWGDLLSMRLNVPHWNIESPLIQNRYRLLLAAYRTLLMSVRPWRFWRELKMIHEPRWLRLCGYPMVLLPLLYLVFALSVGVAVERIAQRAVNHGFGTVSLPPTVILLKSAVMPFSSTPLVSSTIGPGGWAPRNLAARVDWLRIVHTAMRNDRFFHPGMRDLTPARAGQALLMIMLAPVGFLALPISRRVCKVRWRHVARIWLYSLPLILIPLGVDICEQILDRRGGSYYHGKLLLCDLLIAIPALILIIWWSVAANRYLKMTWPWLVGVAVIVLPVAVICFLIELYAFMTFA